jgi:MIP family channel proteins
MLSKLNSVQDIRHFGEQVSQSPLNKYRLYSSLVDVKTLPIFRATFAEFIATGVMVLFSCCAGSADPANDIPDPTVLRIALVNGLLIATMIWIFANLSGAHVNPAVTIGFLVARRISALRALLYLLAQISGAVLGAAVARVIVYSSANELLGVTLLHHRITVVQGFFIELLMTMVLMLTVMASSDSIRVELQGSKPLSIGLCVAMNCFIFAPFTGASMNPARSLGPAVIVKRYEDHWVYWVAPILGASIGALLYDHLVHTNVSIHRFTAYLTNPDYNSEDIEYPIQSFWKSNDRQPSVYFDMAQPKNPRKSEVMPTLHEEEQMNDYSSEEGYPHV